MNDAANVCAGLMFVAQREPREHFESFDLMFEGYDDDPREVYEVPGVRAWVGALDARFTGWLFLFSKESLGLQAVMFALTGAHYEDGQATMDSELLTGLLERWWRGMNALCSRAGFSSDQIDQLTNQVARYVQEGPSWLADEVPGNGLPPKTCG